MPIRRLIDSNKPLTISVLGDSTGTGRAAWVNLLAERLGRRSQVTILGWTSALNQYGEPLVYGTTGRTITIWNASSPGARADYPSDKLKRLQPRRPDLVIYSFGHHAEPSTIRGEMEATHRAVRTQWGSFASVVIKQNPALGASAAKNAAVQQILTEWALEQQIPVVDVASVFPERRLESLMANDLIPNPAGQKLWARKVEASLIGG